MNKYDNSYIGKKFGHLTVEKVYKKHFLSTGKNLSMFLCKCDCGREKELIASNIVNGYMVNRKRKKHLQKILNQNFVVTQIALTALILIASGTDSFQVTRNMT